MHVTEALQNVALVRPQWATRWLGYAQVGALRVDICDLRMGGSHQSSVERHTTVEAENVAPSLET